MPSQPIDNLNEEPNVDPEGVDNDYSEDSVRDVHFDDSEKERAIGAGDGFSIPEVGQAEADLNERVRNAQNHAGYAGERSGVASGNGNANVGGFAPPDVANMHNMEEEYESEELGSDVESIDGNEETRNKYERYQKADMCKTFKWKLGMEFGLINEFKDAMVEHSILN
ncbi:hypothetical protein SESBI_38781, partial [Sesbania bispinosa]